MSRPPRSMLPYVHKSCTYCSELKTRRDMSIIFITHDLSLVREIGDRAAVVYAGKVVEVAPVEHILSKPAHPYTIGLISCLPDISTELKDSLPYRATRPILLISRPDAPSIPGAPALWRSATRSSRKC